VSARLEVRDLTAGYGGLPVASRVSLQVVAGSLTALVGPNGAGKTTLLRALAGVLPSTGTILLDGVEIAGESVSRRVARGMVLVPEGRQLFADMTVRENLELGGYLRPRRQRADGVADALAFFPLLADRHSQRAGTLSGGEQQLLALARALVASPKLLLLDEPSLGLAPKMVQEVFRIVRLICTTGISILLVEQNVRQALAIADYSYVLERGSVVAEGSGPTLLQTDLIHRTYLGRS
jgi:branched-chain amino acid transport system ATP-binding protein